MKLLPATLARERPQRYPMAAEQPELPNLPPPMTANRAKNFKRPCNHCAVEECRCIGWIAFDVVN
jgi:hypothetical protein